MSFHDVRFPDALSIGSFGGAGFSTDIVTLSTGFEKRNVNWSQARRQYGISLAGRTPAEIAEIVAFFHARQGRGYGFRFKDPSDWHSGANMIATPAATDQQLGTGTGSLTTFALVKRYVSGAITHIRPITKPVAGTVLIALNGVNQATGWSVNTTTGIVTFTTAPANGVLVTAGFAFDVPVRFDTDTLTGTFETPLYQSFNDLSIVEVRV